MVKRLKTRSRLPYGVFACFAFCKALLAYAPLSAGNWPPSPLWTGFLLFVGAVFRLMASDRRGAERDLRKALAAPLNLTSAGDLLAAQESQP